MPKAYSLDLRESVVGFVEDGHSRRAAAAHFEAVGLLRRKASIPSPAAAVAMRSSNRIGHFFWRRWSGKPTSPCRNWRPNLPPRPARRLIPLPCRLAHSRRLSFQKRMARPVCKGVCAEITADQSASTYPASRAAPPAKMEIRALRAS